MVLMERDGVQSEGTDVEFGPYRLDTKREQLWRDNRPVDIRRKTWLVLRHLIAEPGRLVSRDELLDTVWPDVEVVPAAVTQSIHELRQAFATTRATPNSSRPCTGAVSDLFRLFVVWSPSEKIQDYLATNRALPNARAVRFPVGSRNWRA